MTSLFTELRRRNVFKVGAAYAIVAWLLIEVSSVVLPTFDAPRWIAQTVTFLLIIGFPVALLLAWAYEMTPDGIKADADVPRDSITPATGQRLNYLILGLVVLAVGFLVTDQYVLDQGIRASVVGTGRSVVTNPTTAPASVQASRFTINLESSEPVGDTGLSAHLALSPDGRLLVYAAQVEGKRQLYLRALDHFDTQPMPGTDGAYHPFFSPDGETVAFYTDLTSATNLKKVSVQGGLPQDLADTFFSSGGSWELDDTIIYGTGDNATGRSLFRIPANGGTPETLISADADRGYVMPEVLPGGDAILFVIRPGQGGAGNARDGSIAVLSLATGEVRTLIEGGYRPQYAPTGHLVFVRREALWAVPFDVGRLETTGPEVPVLDGVENDGFRGSAAYAFSDNGMLVYVPGGDAVSRGIIRSLVWVDRQGREEPLAAEPRRYINPRLSPDGQQLAVSVFDGTNWDVWVYDLERDTSSRLTFASGTDDRPLWTPDSERVVFRSTRDGGGLFSKAGNGTGPVTLLSASTAPQYPQSFSPDGTQLVFRELGGQGWDLHVLSLAGESISQPLLQSAFNERSAAISQDGRWLAYDSDETERYEVYVRPFPNVDAGKWQISRDGGTEPLWGPDGGELFYRSAEGVMAVSVETEPDFSAGSPRLLFQEIYADSVSTTQPSYHISPDGQRFLMMSFSGLTEQNLVQTQLRVVENWFEELNRLAPPPP